MGGCLLTTTMLTTTRDSRLLGKYVYRGGMAPLRGILSHDRSTTLVDWSKYEDSPSQERSAVQDLSSEYFEASHHDLVRKVPRNGSHREHSSENIIET